MMNFALILLLILSPLLALSANNRVFTQLISVEKPLEEEIQVSEEASATKLPSEIEFQDGLSEEDCDYTYYPKLDSDFADELYVIKRNYYRYGNQLKILADTRIKEIKEAILNVNETNDE